MQALRWVLPFIFVFSVFSLEVYLIWPPDLAQTVNQTPEFRFKVVDNSSTTFSCTLYIDNSPFGTNESVLNDTESFIIANNSLSLGDHTWYINCTDGTNYNVSETRTIGIGQNFSRCAVLIDSNVTYYLVGNATVNIDPCIWINAKENTTLDCLNNSITGSGSGTGIKVDYYPNLEWDEGVEDIEVKNCFLENFSTGVYTSEEVGRYVSIGVKIDNLNVFNSENGLVMYYSRKSNIKSSKFENISSVGIYLKGTSNCNITNTIFRNVSTGIGTAYIPSGTLVEGCRFYGGSKGIGMYTSGFTVRDSYFENQTYSIIMGNTPSNIVIENTTFYLGEYGMFLTGSGSNIKVDNCRFYNKSSGIYLSFEGISNVLVANSEFKNNTYGLHLSSKYNITVYNSVIENNKYGVYIKDSESKYIKGCDIKGNEYGVYLQNTNSSEVYGNVIENNSLGIYLEGKDNTIYNNFFNNTNNTYIGSIFSNSWNIQKTPGTNIVGGPYLGGNYWVGFSETCNDINYDGICDEKYIIDQNNIDYLPLTNPKSPDNVIESKFSLGNNFQMIFFFSYENFFRFYFDHGGKNYSIKFWDSKGEIDEDREIKHLFDYKEKSGIIKIACDQNVKISVGGYSFVINDNCLGGKIRFECDSCKIGPLGIVGEIS